MSFRKGRGDSPRTIVRATPWPPSKRHRALHRWERRYRNDSVRCTNCPTMLEIPVNGDSFRLTREHRSLASDEMPPRHCARCLRGASRISFALIARVIIVSRRRSQVSSYREEGGKERKEKKKIEKELQRGRKPGFSYSIAKECKETSRRSECRLFAFNLEWDFLETPAAITLFLFLANCYRQIKFRGQDKDKDPK